MKESDYKLISQLIENTPDPCYILDSQWRFSYLNKAALKLLQKTKEELLGKIIWMEFPYLENSEIYDAFSRAFSLQKVIKIQYLCPLLDIWLEITAIPFSEGLSVHLRDITDQVLAIEKHLQSEERYHRLVEFSPVPMVIQAEGKWVHLNRAAVELLGAKSAQELIGKSIFDFIHPTYWEIVKKQIREANEEGKEIPLHEKKFIRLDGREIDVEVSALLISYQGQPAVLGVLYDITERKRYEEKLLEGERFLTSIFESIQDGLCVIDYNLNIVRINPTIEKWYAHEAPLVGKKCYQVYKGTSQRCEGCPLNSELARGDSAYGVIAKRGPGEKSQGWLEIHNYPLIDSTTQQVKGIIKYCRDITEKKRIEQEMTRFQSLNLIGEMAASIGHEVRNPMTTVRGFLQLFKSRKEYAKCTEQLDLLIDELDRANSIITEFLSLANNRNIDFKSQNLNEIIKTLTPLIKADAMVSDKILKLNLASIPDIPVNEKEIRQLILNLVRNGLEAMEHGGILEIKTCADSQGVILSVKDQGQGIPQDILDKLGTPFLTTKETGTGLGLAVCYSIATKHKAGIKVETGSSGTTVLVHFVQYN